MELSDCIAATCQLILRGNNVLVFATCLVILS